MLEYYYLFLVTIDTMQLAVAILFSNVRVSVPLFVLFGITIGSKVEDVFTQATCKMNLC